MAIPYRNPALKIRADVTNERIAFYSPLKPPDHAIPSGDRLMARSLIDCMIYNGYQVDVASRLRVFVKEPADPSGVDRLKILAHSEIERLSQSWLEKSPPALWFCYHPYYKSPDLIGPELCQRFNIPYVTAEASYSERRAHGDWASLQQLVLSCVKNAAVNICFTERDKSGLRQVLPSARLASLPPFIDTQDFSQPVMYPAVPKLITVAMMRAGDKMDSYIHLATALQSLLHKPWTLSVVGDGPMRAEIEALFDRFPADRIQWHGRKQRTEIAALFARSTVYVWPGCGEAYGLAYLEAQAAGLPVVAFDNAGVPEVVDAGYSGILTSMGDNKAFATAVESLLDDEQECRRLSQQARSHVRRNHDYAQASQTLNAILQEYVGLNS